MSYRFFAVDGMDGAGKTTLLQTWLKPAFHNHGIPLTLFRDLGETPAGEHIRSYLLDTARRDIGPHREALLIGAQHLLLVEQCIRPALAASHVATDRSMLGTLVYQWMTVRGKASWVRKLNRVAFADVLPELIIILDVPAEIAAERVSKRNHTDWFERNTKAFNRQRKAFRALHESGQYPTVLMDGTQPPEDVFKQAFHHLRTRLLDLPV